MTWGEQNTDEEAFEQLDMAFDEFGVNFVVSHRVDRRTDRRTDGQTGDTASPSPVSFGSPESCPVCTRGYRYVVKGGARASGPGAN